MPTLAFWNIARNVAPATIAAFAHESDADILILAENEIPGETLVLALNSGANRYYFPDPVPPGRLSIFTRFLPEPSPLVRDYGRVSIRHYRVPTEDSFLVVAVHLSSKLWMDDDDQSQLATRIPRYIRDAEEQVGHQRTIVIGDLNMNPFEVGMVSSEGLHGVMDKNIALRGSRMVAEESRLFLYNPMWSFFGDRGPAPPGTYYYNSGNPTNYFWNIFDQVLIRPSLLGFLEKDAVDIVTEIGGMSLLNEAGYPDREIHSDHLPLVCRLSVIKELVNG